MVAINMMVSKEWIMIRKLFLTVFCCIFVYCLSAQCPGASATCGGETVAAGTGGPVGPAMDCLGNCPNPIYYSLEVSASGNIDFNLAGNPARDLDFALFGPYASEAAAQGSCAGFYPPLADLIDCSYAGGTAPETPSIGVNAADNTTPAVAGEYYLLVICNFSNQATDVTLNVLGSSTGALCAAACSVNGTPMLDIGACDGMSTANTADDIFTVTLTVDFSDATSAMVTFDGAAMSSTNTMTTTGGNVMYTIDLPADGAANAGVVVIGDGSGTCTIDFTDFNSPASCSPLDCDADAGTITADASILCNLSNVGTTDLSVMTNGDFEMNPADPCGLAGTPGVAYGLYSAAPTSEDTGADPNFITFIGDGPMDDPGIIMQAVEYGAGPLSFGMTPGNAATNYNTTFFICPVYLFDQDGDPSSSGGTTAVDYDCGPPESLCRDVNENACVSFLVLEPILFSNDMLTCDADPYTGTLTADVGGGDAALNGTMLTLTNSGGNGTLSTNMISNGGTFMLNGILDGPFEIMATDANGCSQIYAGVWNQPTITFDGCEDKVCTTIPNNTCSQDPVVLTDCFTGAITPQLGSFTITMPGDGFNNGDGTGFEIRDSGGNLVFNMVPVAAGAVVTTTGLNTLETYTITFVDAFGDGISCAPTQGGMISDGDGGANNFGTIVTIANNEWQVDPGTGGGGFCGGDGCGCLGGTFSNAVWPVTDNTYGPIPIGAPSQYIDPIGVISGPGITDNGDNTADFNAATAGPGTHTINYDFTDAQGCVLHEERMITVCEPPAMPTSASSCAPSCTNAAVPLLMAMDGGGTTPTDEFEWYDSGAVDVNGQPTGTLLATGANFDPSTVPGFDPDAEICTSYFAFARGPESTGNPISGDVACYSCPLEIDFYRCVAGNPGWTAPAIPICAGDELALHTLTDEPVDMNSVWSIVSVQDPVTNAPVTAPFAGTPAQAGTPAMFNTNAGGGNVTVTITTDNPTTGQGTLMVTGNNAWTDCILVGIEHYKDTPCAGCNGNTDCDLSCAEGLIRFVEVCPLPDVEWSAGKLCCTADPVFLGGNDPGGLVSLTTIGGSYPNFMNGQWTGQGVTLEDPDSTPDSGDEFYQFDPMGLDGEYTVIYSGGDVPCFQQHAQDFEVSCGPLLADFADMTVCPGGIVKDMVVYTDLGDCNIQISTSGLAAAGGTDLTNVPVNATNGTAVIQEFTATMTEGTYAISVTAQQTNAQGCNQTVMFNIIVADDGGITFTNCPVSDIMKSSDAGVCTAAVSFDAPTAIDDCTDQNNITVTQTAGPASGSNFLVGTTTVTYEATDGNGNTATCSFDVVVMDTEAPNLVCPSDIVTTTSSDVTGNCTAVVNGIAPTTNTDNCGVTGTTHIITGATSGSGGADASGTAFNIGISFVTYTSVDAAGNSTSCTFSVSVTDDEAPSITCPTNVVNLMCGDAIPAPTDLAGLSASDNCTAQADLRLIVSDIDNGLTFCDANRTITRTYTVTDESGNQTSCSQTLQFVEDTTNPSIAVPAAPLALSCDDISETSSPSVAILDWLASATATDACSTPTISHDFNMNSLDVCAAVDYSITVTFTATDACGNTSDDTQTINISVDDEDPMMTAPAAPLVLDCNDVSETSSPAAQIDAWLAMASATDACDEDPVITHSFDMSELDVCAAADYSITVTFTATDACGNTNQATQMINVEVDDEDPMMTAPAAPLVLDCNDVSETSSPAAQIDAWLAMASATDACDEDPAISHSFDMSELDVCAAADYSITVTFTATDACGNTNQATQMINVEVDDEDPMMTAPAAPLVLDCGDISETSSPAAQIGAWLATASATDACDEDPAISHSFDMSELDVCAVADYSITVTFTATDACGNTNQATQMINVVVDTTDPIMMAPPAALVLDCDDISETSSPAAQIDAWLAMASATDACDEDPAISHSFDMSELDVCAAADYSITVTFTATDACGNTNQATQMINVEVDDEDPTAIPPAQPLVLDCDDISETSDPAILIKDWLQEASATDNCDEDPVLSIDYDISLLDVCAAADYSITVTFTATDACGNTGEATQMINVEVDDEDPTVIPPTQPLMLDCYDISETSSPAAQIDAWLAMASATDGCDEDPVLTHSFDMSALDICAAADYSLTVTFTATDACGNTNQATQTIDVTVDDDNPTVMAPPATLALDCSDINANTSPAAQIDAWLAMASATDGCDEDPVLTHSFDMSQLEICAAADYSLTVTFTATDACGNTDQATQTIDITVDDTPPVIDMEAVDITVECNGASNSAELLAWLNNNGMATATDDCNVVVWSNNYGTFDAGACDGEESVEVIFTATDGCGNANTTTATLTIDDTTAPVWEIDPVNITLECDGSVDPYAEIDQWLDAAGYGDAEDDCSIIVYSNNYTGLSDECGATGTATVTFTATDACGNNTDRMATVTVIDVTPPDITSPARDEVVECDGAGNTAELAAWLANNGGATASDVCDADPLTWNNTLIETIDNCGLTSEMVYSFTATDACDNVSAATIASFIIVDTTSPTITMQAMDMMVECDGDGNEAQLMAWLDSNGGAMAEDDCSDEPLAWEYDLVTEEDLCDINGMYTYRFTVTDNCGNTSTTEAVFTIVDTTPPEITGGENYSGECDQSNANNDDELISWLNNNAGATVTDDCSSDLTWTNNYHIDNWVDGCNDTRMVDVTFTATDECGNASDVTFTFSTGDVTAPVFTNCPRPDIVENAEHGHCDAYINFSMPEAIDNCGIPIITNLSPINPETGLPFTSGDRYPVGTTILTFEAEDDCGNTSQCEIKVIVNDYWEVPQITCPENVTMPNDPFMCGAVVDNIEPTVTDFCPDNLFVTYQIMDETGAVIETGFDDASGFKFPVGTNTVTYCAQDQPLLLISEITQDADNPNGGMMTPPVPVADGDDYIEITNFGKASYDLSCLVIERTLPGNVVETFVVPAGTILAPGDVLVLHYGPGTDDTTAPGLLFNLAGSSDIGANVGAAYAIYYGANDIDAMTMFADAEGGIIREDLYDTDTPDDFVLAETCNPITLGMYNPSYPPVMDNGTTTSLQSDDANVATCMFEVDINDEETPFCAEFDFTTYDGTTGPITSGACQSFIVNIPTSIIIGDVNVLGLNIAHADISELSLYLTSPNGTTVELFSEICPGTADLNTSLDSDSTMVVNDPLVCPDINAGNIYAPVGSLFDFCTEDAQGDWILEIGDGVAGNDGTLISWSLEIGETLLYSQGDTIIDNDPGLCGAEFTWFHPEFADNCCEGTIEVEYLTDDDINVPMGGIVTDGGSEVTEFFEVGTTTVKYTLTDLAGNMSMCSFDVTVLDIEDPMAICPDDIVIDLDPTECRIAVDFALDATDNCSIDSLYSVPPSGSLFEIGVTEVLIIAVDPSGNRDTCMFNVTVNEFIPTDSDLACIAEINLSLNRECEAVLHPDQVLTGDNYRCLDNYCIEIFDAQGNPHSNMFDITDIGQTFTYCVSDCLGNGEKCWGIVNVEEKHIPIISCPEDLTLGCNQPTDPVFTGTVVLESCEPGIIIRHEDEFTDFGNCNDPRAQIIRTWYVEDQDGNEVSCVQTITIEPFDLDDIVFPPDYTDIDADLMHNAFSCSDVDERPEIVTSDFTGYPTYNGEEILTAGNLCMISMNVSDEIFDICPGSYEILRTWKVRNMCGPITPTNPLTHIQIIKVIDNEGPIIHPCPEDMIISTSPWECLGETDLPIPHKLEDVCSGVEFTASLAGPGRLTQTGSIENGDLRVSVSHLPKGPHVITYFVSDECGNVSTCEFTVTVEDLTAPTVTVIQSKVITLTGGTENDADGLAKLFAVDLDNGSHDNCTDVKLEIRRDSDICALPGNTTYNADGHTMDGSPSPTSPSYDPDNGEFVKFCCADATNAIVDVDGDGVPDVGFVKVWIRVWDDGNMDGILGSPHIPGGKNDNYNEAWAYVKVEDKNPPTIICPPDLTLNCDDDYDQSVTGSPVVYGICTSGESELVSEQVNVDCGVGTVRRTWAVVGHPNIRCTQTITLTNQNPPFTDAGINWPRHYDGSPGNLPAVTTATNCEGDFEVPTILQGPCDRVTESLVDIDTFEFEEGACMKIIRKWEVIDWCTYDANATPEVGIWRYDQIIKVNDEVAPELQGCIDEMFDVDLNCENRNVALSNSATDDGGCGDNVWIKWQILVDTWGDGQFDWEYTSYSPTFDAAPNGFNSDNNGNGIPDVYVAPTASGEEINIIIPETIDASMINHKVLWKATDGCGNVTECETTFMVVDKKAPTPYCINLGTAPMGIGGSVDVWAIDFDNGATDNCTDQENLRFTFSATPPEEDANYDPTLRSSSITFDAPEDCCLQVVDIYVWDEKGNSDFCAQEIFVSGEACDCENGPLRMIAGKLQTDAGDGVENVMVEVQSEQANYPAQQMTDDLGGYAFDSNLINETYELGAYKNDDVLNGVTTIDLFAIQKHILGIEPFNSPYQMIAGDVNSDEKIRSSDISTLRKTILGIYDEFPGNLSWRFIDGEQLPNDASNPWPLDETIQIDALSSDMMTQDFMAVKIGDVNGSAVANAQSKISSQSRFDNSIDLIYDVDRLDSKSKIVKVKVTSDNFADVHGMQMTAQFKGWKFIEVEPGMLDISLNNIGVHGDKTTSFSWFSMSPVSINDGDVLFELILELEENTIEDADIYLDSSITPIEGFVGTNTERVSISISKRNAIMPIKFNLYQNQPNPFEDKTTIVFDLPKSADVDFKIYDINGKIVYSYSDYFVKGTNSINIDRDMMPGVSGALYYELTSGSHSATKKMILIK